MEELPKDDLSITVHRAIAAGRVPDHRPERTWGGRGNGARCAICGTLVRCDQLGFEVDFAAAGDSHPGPLHMHVRCYHAWDSLLGAPVEGLKLANGDRSICGDEWGIDQSQGKR